MPVRSTRRTWPALVVAIALSGAPASERALLALAGATPHGERATLVPEAERAASGITTDELRAHLEFLASDELQGRGVGHDGNRVAARYLASVFRRIGLTPAEGDSFLQPVPLYTARPGPASSLRRPRPSPGGRPEGCSAGGRRW